MLSYPDEVVAALADHQAGRLVGLAQYQGSQVEFDVAESGSVSFRASGEIQSDASITPYGIGDSLVPKAQTDLLAPYGQEVSLFRELIIRDSVWRIPLGVFRVTGWDNANEDVLVTSDADLVSSTGTALSPAGTGLYSVPGSWSPTATGLYSVPSGYSSAGTGLYSLPGTSSAAGTATRVTILGWSLDVELADRFRLLQRSQLLDTKSPTEATMYEEIRALSPMPVQVNAAVPDVNVPPGMVYESGRLGAVRALADLAGAVPHMTREGVLTVRKKDAWAEAVLTPVFDIDGTIEWDDGQTDEFYNYVRVSDPDDKYVAFAVLDDDAHPLSISRAGVSTYEHVSPAYTSQNAADQGARTILNRVLNRRSRVVTVKCTPVGLLLELGDVGWFRDPVQQRAVLGEVSSVEVPNDVTEPLTVSVIVAEVS